MLPNGCGWPSCPRQRFIRAGRAILGVALIALWWLAAVWLGPLLLPRPDEVFRRLVETIASGELILHAGSTLALSFAGFAAATLAGVVAPIVLNFFPRASDALQPYVRGAMGLPPFALAPLLILWFGIGVMPKFVIVFTVVFFLMYTACEAGVRNIDMRLVKMARVAGAGPSMVAREIMLWSTLPFILVGAKIALPRAIGAAIVGEFIVSDRGIGYYIEHSRQMADNIGVFTGVTLVTILILGCSTMMRWLEQRLLRWRAQAPEGM